MSCRGFKNPRGKALSRKRTPKFARVLDCHRVAAAATLWTLSIFVFFVSFVSFVVKFFIIRVNPRASVVQTLSPFMRATA